jgi:hypothetical protein
MFTIGEDGKIVEHKSIRDDLLLMVQLGVAGPKSKEYEPLFQAWKGLKGIANQFSSFFFVDETISHFVPLSS